MPLWVPVGYPIRYPIRYHGHRSGRPNAPPITRKTMNTRTAAYGRLLADLQARSAASDAAAAEALEELNAAGLALADRMAALAAAMEAE